MHNSAKVVVVMVVRAAKGGSDGMRTAAHSRDDEPMVSK